MSSAVGSSSSSTSVTGLSSWWDWIPDWLLDYNSFEETENVDFFSIGIVAGYCLAMSILFWLYWTCEYRTAVGHVASGVVVESMTHVARWL